MAGNSRRTVIKIDNVVKKYETRKGEVLALSNVNMEIKENMQSFMRMQQWKNMECG